MGSKFAHKLLVTCHTLPFIPDSLLFWRVGTCCSSDPVSGTEIPLGTDPDRSLLMCTYRFSLAPRARAKVALDGSVAMWRLSRMQPRILGQQPSFFGARARRHATHQQPARSPQLGALRNRSLGIADVSGRPLIDVLFVFHLKPPSSLADLVPRLCGSFCAARASAPSEKKQAEI